MSNNVVIVFVFRVVIQPWITSSGTMNWELVNVLFTAIIGLLSNHPRIKVTHLIKLLNPVLSGVETMILLDVRTLRFYYCNRCIVVIVYSLT